jgi:signal transduction histidine kinase
MALENQQNSQFQADLSSFVARLRSHWQRRPLHQQFLIGATAVLIPAMLLAGYWVTQLIRDGVVRNSLQPAALYLENFVEPSLQPLASTEQLTAAQRAKLDSLLRDTALARVVASFKVWGRDGKVLYANRAELIGRKFPVGPKQLAAWRGQIAGDFTKLNEDEHITERVLQRPLIEIYFPIRERGTDRIIAVAEFYQDATALTHELSVARWTAWATILGLTSVLLLALHGIVKQGSRTIESQRRALETRVAELSMLKEDVRLASSRSSEHNEMFLRKLSSDLHDGPAQLVAAALLRLDDGPPSATHLKPNATSRDAVRQVLTDALKMLRNLATGLAAPELDGLSLADTVRLAVKKHQDITGTTATLTIATLPGEAAAAVKLCAYRFVQEGLNNAWRHAEARGQSVQVRAEGLNLLIEVTDRGQGFDWQRAKNTGRLGVRGLGDRIRSLGGSLDIDSSAGRGTVLTARIPIGLPTNAEIHAN